MVPDAVFDGLLSSLLLAVSCHTIYDATMDVTKAEAHLNKILRRHLSDGSEHEDQTKVIINVLTDALAIAKGDLKL